MSCDEVPDIYNKDGLPENWEILTDSATGWPYFANHHEKITTWEDPRPGMSQYHPSKTYDPKKSTGIRKREIPITRRTTTPNVEVENTVVVQPTALEIVQRISEEANSLKSKVAVFKDTKQSTQYKYIDEMLTRQLLKLDQIESGGDEEIRLLRRETVRTIQASIDELELKAKAYNPEIQ